MTQPLPWEKNAAVPVPPAPEPVPLDAYTAPAAPEPELVPLDIYDAPAPAPKPINRSSTSTALIPPSARRSCPPRARCWCSPAPARARPAS